MDPQSLTAALEAALVRELRDQIAWQNHVRFKGALTSPVLVLSDSTRRLGQWNRVTRTLELSRALVLARPWPEVISVLEHELAHQYVAEVLKATGEAAHGPTFQRVCDERGIDARAAGQPLA
ncbi:MAG: SprT-like domain-containing protein, partial [Polyangiales bacterium]